MLSWRSLLKRDPLPWLLQDDAPAVRHLALQCLLDRPPDDSDVARARAAAMTSQPIAAILASQHPEGYWEKPGAGYATKYRGTVWQVVFLDQLGADGSDERIRRGTEYVLAHSQTELGGFGASGKIGAGKPPPSSAIHCLNGNVLRALIGLRCLDDERVQRAIDWQARAITGDGFRGYYQSGTSGPGFRCAANDKLPCAWGAIKAMLAFARIPTDRRGPEVERAIEQGAAFLLSCDPATAAYPFPHYTSKPSGSWFQLGFPLGYVSDVLQTLEALCEHGYARDPRLAAATSWLLTKQADDGRWKNQRAYNGKTWMDFEPQGAASKWVTLRASRVLKAVIGDSGGPDRFGAGIP